jgi:hypothetical protein
MRLLMIVSVAGLLGLASPASAQMVGPPRVPTYGPFTRPGLSPYLNLLRNDNGFNNNFAGAAAANYYLGTVPEFQRRANAADFSEAIGVLDERTRPDRPITTGTAPQQNTLRRYFNNTGGYFPPVQTPRR